MAKFDLSLPTILKHEGRRVNHPKDPGGPTSYGVSLRFLQSIGDLDADGFPDGDLNRDGVINEQDINNLTEAQAIQLYRYHFWDPNRYGEINSQSIACKAFDLAINMGSASANKILQRGIRAAMGIKLLEDGIIGDKTLDAANQCSSTKLIGAMKSEAAGFYRMLVWKRPSLSVFLEGWLNRAYSE